MRYVPSDKYTIAWFKLAECVAKGEKEKAFGVYRLLMHSFDDQAYAYQLEGDLLGAFQDGRAIEKYAHAAQLYMQNNRFKEAAAIYRDLIEMEPDDKRYVIRLLDVYKKHKSPDILHAKLIKLSGHLLEKNRPAHAMLVVHELELLGYSDDASGIYEQSIMQLSKLHDDTIGFEEDITRAVECLTKHGNAHQLQNLLSHLEQTNSAWFSFVRKTL